MNHRRLRLLFFPLTILVLFSPAVIQPSAVLFPSFSDFSDLMVIHWPKARLLADTWQAGQGLPAWTPLILSGMPLAANQLAMRFYPPAWLFLFLPLPLTFNLLTMFHLILGGMGIFYLLREAHQLSPTAALLGGLTFALNGKWLAHAAAGHVSMVGAIGWLPWAVFGLMMILSPARSPAPLLPRLKWSLVAAIALAMQMMTHTLIVIYSVYLLAAVVVWHLIFEVIAPPRNRPQLAQTLRRVWLPLLLIPLLAGLLGAAQLLPLLELATFSNRSLSLAQAAEFALTPLQLLVGLLLPTAQAGHEHTIYLGLIPLLLASVGLLRFSRNPESSNFHPPGVQSILWTPAKQGHWPWFYALVFLFAGLFALGPYTPLHRFFYEFAPGFGWVRTPARMFFVGGLAVAVLVGFGVDRLQQATWPAAAQRRFTRLAVGLGAAALIGGGGLMLTLGQVNRATLTLAGLVPLGLALIGLRLHGRLAGSWTVGLLGLLLCLDLVTFGRSLLRFIPLSEALAPGRPVAAYLAAQPGLFRVYSPSYSLPMQTAAEAGLHLADGVEPVHLAIYDQFMARAGGYGQAGFSVTIPNFGDGPLASALQEVEPNLKLLGLLNVEYLAAAFPLDQPGLSLETKIEETFIYRNQQARPRAWLAGQAVPAAADWLGQLERLPADTVVLSDSEGDWPQANGVAGEAHPAAVTISHYSPDRIAMRVDPLAAPGAWLVLSELWYPGWQATVNGQPQPVERVNGLLRGVYLTGAGPFEVTLVYRPAGLVWGGWLSSLAALGVTLGLVYFSARAANPTSASVKKGSSASSSR